MIRPNVALALAGMVAAAPAVARTLLVGPGRDYALPSAALAAAQDGDTVSLAPGQYFDCAIVRANHLTIQGEPGGTAALTDKICEEKALLVLRGNGTTIRDLTLQRARAPDGNGAGIRLEAPDLAIERVHFDNDQVGLLSGSAGGTVTVADGRFTAGGVGGDRPKYALMIDRSARFAVTGSTFEGVKGGQITSAADRTEIVGNHIAAGAGDAEESPSYAILATAGSILVQDNRLTIGPLAPRPGTAIGLWDDATAIIRGNRMENHTGHPLALLQDWTSGDPALSGNTIGPGDTLVTSSGLWRHRASTSYYAAKQQAHDWASQAKRLVKRVLGR